MCVLSVKVPTRKKSGNLFNDQRIYIYIYIYIYEALRVSKMNVSKGTGNKKVVKCCIFVYKINSDGFLNALKDT